MHCLHRRATIAAVSVLATLVMATLITSTTALADEGMWTFDNPPNAQLQERYGFTATPAWLERLQLSCVRIGGGSGSFVSPDGLVLTNAQIGRAHV